MLSLYDVPAPAKLNLFLHITGRRDDGYHLLQSVFMLIDWCDTLHFSLRRDGQLTREDLGPALPPDDLTLRAAHALQQSTGCSLGAHIGVLKRVPAQAGMGGGAPRTPPPRCWHSTASGSWACARRNCRPLRCAWVPTCRFSCAATMPGVEGIGERITPLTGASALPTARFAVVKPAAGIETAKIFASPALKRDSDSATILGFAAAHYDFGRNDLQSVAQALRPDVQQALDWLQARGLHGRMTGSGSVVFAQMPHAVDLSGAPGTWQVKACENLTQHPLAGWAED
jgi:4-diphosphocytidyl-2-C-methyl-D-erythritol kinase